MVNGFRIWFLVLYAIGIIVLLIKFVPTRDRAKAAERRIEDSRRLLPMIFLPVDWFVPPLIVLSGIGQVSAVWPPVRILGLALSLYGLIITDLGAMGPRSVSGSAGGCLPRPWRPGPVAWHSPGDAQLDFTRTVVSIAGR